jgi:hypothetical protein
VLAAQLHASTRPLSGIADEDPSVVHYLQSGIVSASSKGDAATAYIRTTEREEQYALGQAPATTSVTKSREARSSTIHQFDRSEQGR